MSKHTHAEKQCCDHIAPQDVVQSTLDEVEEQAPNGSAQSVFSIIGMDCADCAFSLEKKVGYLSEVTDVQVNFGAAKMTVHYPSSFNPQIEEKIMKTVKLAGYEAVPRGERADIDVRPFWQVNKKLHATLISGLFIVLALLGSSIFDISPTTEKVLFLSAMVLGGFRIALSGVSALKSRMIGIDLLMTIAVIGAAFIGEWFEGAAVVFLFSLGETLEAYTMDRARNSLRSLMQLAPNEVRLIREGQEIEVPTEDVQIGDIVLVKPGEKIGVDGKVRQGHSFVNQASITGESVPVEKEIGDSVYAGTMNEQGSLQIEVTKLAKDNALSKIIHLVEEAQAEKAPSQRFVDRFSQIYTPVVIIAAVLIAILPPLFLNQSFESWLYSALMLLVVSCPCALVISTPVSIVSAISHAAKQGILIKGGVYLEQLGAIPAIAFDKTGTLTAGFPEVKKIISLDGQPEHVHLATAASLEQLSEHPLAAAVVRKAQENNLPLHAVEQFMAVTGNGVQAKLDHTLYFIGSPRWFECEMNRSLTALESQLKGLQEAGMTLMLLGTETKFLALIGLADQVRPESKQMIADLRKHGMKQIVMLTGDHEGTAKHIAKQVGQIDYRAGLMPEDKVKAIMDLQQTHQSGVVMVGDGVNDAPALATATVGIAMGRGGTDVALETSDITLMTDDLSRIPQAIGLSRKTLRIIKQNIAFSLLVKAVFIGLILLGLSTLWLAVLADTGSSLLVIANGMRLLRAKS